MSRRRLASLGWLLLGFALGICTLTILQRWFPVESLVFVAWGAFGTALWFETGPGAPRKERRPHWARNLAVFYTVETVGMGLLFGGLWPDDDRNGDRVTGAVIGGVLVLSAFLVPLRSRRRRVSEPVSVGPGEQDGHGVAQDVRQDRAADAHGHGDERPRQQAEHEHRLEARD